MIFVPDFAEDCYECGRSPCVIVKGHIVPKTHLCGPCFFHDANMIDYEEWNTTTEEEET